MRQQAKFGLQAFSFPAGFLGHPILSVTSQTSQANHLQVRRCSMKHNDILPERPGNPKSASPTRLMLISP